MRSSHRWGVAARLTTGLVALTLLAAVSAAVALWATDRLRRGFDHVAVHHVGRLTAVARLAQRSESIVATAPRLAAARDLFELEHQRLLMLDQFGLLDDAVAELPPTGIPEAAVDEVRRHRAAMAANLKRLAELMAERLAL
ncbi:MAG: hypothetical protein HQL39_13690, partial [Alphaproteobacteria bacterium]|nr:hypothetical protein [Alphaproteobacteria bacterium]